MGPCKNPQCKSYGKPHPNCRCYGFHGYAEGGTVHCAGSHQPECEYYLARGGQVPAIPSQIDSGQSDQPSITLDHIAAERGLLGLLNGSLGRSRLKEPEKHSHIIDDAKAQHRHRRLPVSQDGLEETPPKKSHGTRLGDHILNGHHDRAAEHMEGHALFGSIGKSDLEPIVKRLAGPMMERETDPEALRTASDYLHSSLHGSRRLDHHISQMMESKKLPSKEDDRDRLSRREALKEHLDQIQTNPSAILDISGKLGHYLPDHATQLGYSSSVASTYLNSLKPKHSQMSPLDRDPPVDPIAQDAYHRQLDIANHPLSVLDNVRNGSVHPQDVVTIKTIYPDLYKTMVSKVGEALIHAKADQKRISYAQKLGMSRILAQPLDHTMLTSSMQAIINSAKPQGQAQGQQDKQKAPSTQTQKTIDKTASLYALPDEKREMKQRA